MKMSNFRKNVLVAAIGATLTMGMASQASATPGVFTIDPTVIPSTSIFAGFMAAFNADFVNATTSELLTQVPGPNTTSGSGWAQFTSYSLGGPTISGITTGLGGVDYGLYATYYLSDVLTSGTLGAAGSTADLTAFNVIVWADPNLDTTFSNANATTSTNATVGGNTANDIVLATASLITGVDGIDSLGGAYSNAVLSFAVCTGAGTANVGKTAVADPYCANGTGYSYFAAPDFYQVAFSEFNNTTQGVIKNGNLVSITNASGGVDFNNVPEPATLGLLGLGLLGMGASLFKRKTG